MSRGGKRTGAGSKPIWNHGKTKVIRVPEALAEKIIEIAKILDAEHPVDDVTLSKNDSVTASNVINLSGITVHAFTRGPGVYLADLVKAGYQIKPDSLAMVVKKRIEKDLGPSLKRELDKAIDNLLNNAENPQF